MERDHKRVDKKGKRESYLNRRSSKISFSASLPEDVRGAFAGSICVVRLSLDPLSDLISSILEMIEQVGVRDWNEMEELIYCYVALNSPEVHHFIVDAFLSLCRSSFQDC